MNAPMSIQTLQQQGGAVAAQTHQNAVQPVRAGFFDLQGFELLQRVAKAFSSSTLVPTAYQGNVANCMIALNLAKRLGADELMVMQNLYIVHGNPGWSSKFLIASVNTCGRFNALRYEWRGEPGAEDYGCRAWTIEKETGDRLDGIWVDWKMVKAEGWHSKNGSKWKTMPDQMFVYRAAAFWARAYAPEISMGLQTAEELADVIDVRADGSYTVTAESLRTNIQHVDAEGVIHEGKAPAQVHAHSEGATAAPAHQQAPSFDGDAFADQLEQAADLAALDALASQIPTDAGPDLTQVLLGVAARRREQLQQETGQSAAPTTSRRGRASSMPSIE